MQFYETISLRNKSIDNSSYLWFPAALPLSFCCTMLKMQTTSPFLKACTDMSFHSSLKMLQLTFKRKKQIFKQNDTFVST